MSIAASSRASNSGGEATGMGAAPAASSPSFAGVPQCDHLLPLCDGGGRQRFRLAAGAGGGDEAHGREVSDEEG